MEIIPAIDLIDGKCVRLNQGDFEQVSIYGNNPCETAKYWEKAGAKRLHIVDLDGARQGKPIHFQLIKDIVNRVEIPLQVGGGIRSYSIMQKYFKAGVDRLIVSTIALEDQDLLDRALNSFGSERLLVSVDSRDNKVAVRGWLDTSDIEVEKLVSRLTNKGINNYIFTDINRDGTMEGPNLALINKLNCEDITLLAAGGITSSFDLKKLKNAGVDGAIIGRALYEGKIDLEKELQ